MRTKMGKYLCTFCPDNPRATKEGYVYIHVLVAEKKLGRHLTKEECVHHIDEDKYNNTEDNIIVFKTNSDHAAFHKGVEAVQDGDVWWCPNKKSYLICPVCGGIKDNHAKMCTSCKNDENMRKIISRRIIKVKKESKLDYLIQLTEGDFRNQLKNDIRACNFTDVAKIYDVTDNAVRKWCDKYDLPRHTNIIELIPDNEWESEILSEETLRLINEYYEAKKSSDKDIVDFYLHTPSLTITANKFHSDIDTIKKILNLNNIRILSAGMVRNLHPIEQYENGILINSFLNSLDASKWMIENNKSTNTVKNLSYKILESCKKGNTFLNYTWKINDSLEYEQFLRVS